LESFLDQKKRSELFHLRVIVKHKKIDMLFDNGSVNLISRDEPPMIMDEYEIIHILKVDDFSPEYLDELQEHVILDIRIVNSQ
jgi:hypothetical protein